MKCACLVWLAGLPVLLFAAGCAVSSDPTLRGLPRGMHVITEDEFYDVEGSTVATLRTSLRKNGPTLHGRTVLGLASWRIEPKYQTVFKTGECQMNKVDVFLHIIITLPRWQPPPDVDSLLVEQWQTYVAAISEHEEGHRAISIEAVKNLTRDLWRLRAFDCTEIHTRVSDRYDAFYDDITTKQNTYDRVYKPIYWPPPPSTQR